MNKEQLKNMSVQEMKQIYTKQFRLGRDVDLCKYLACMISAKALRNRGMISFAIKAEDEAGEHFDVLPEEIQVGE